MLNLQRLVVTSTARSSGLALTSHQCRFSSDGHHPGTGDLKGAQFLPFKGEPAARKPSRIKVEKGKTYKWCSCGYSRRQPFCDGSHSRPGLTMLRPVHYVAEKDGTVAFCDCKQTEKRAMCDGSHKNLPARLRSEMPPEMPLVQHQTGPVDDGYAKKLGLKIKHGFHL